VEGLTSDGWAAYVDKYAEVKEFTFNRCFAFGSTDDDS
jgi:hypothetical protein